MRISGEDLISFEEDWEPSPREKCVLVGVLADINSNETLSKVLAIGTFEYCQQEGQQFIDNVDPYLQVFIRPMSAFAERATKLH